MKIPAYISLLTPAERVASLNMGVSMKCAQAGVKQASLISLSPDGIMKAVLVTSLLGGVPLGAAAHIIGRRVSGVANKEREMKEKIKYYRNATRGLESGLATTGPAETQDSSVT